MKILAPRQPEHFGRRLASINIKHACLVQPIYILNSQARHLSGSARHPVLNFYEFLVNFTLNIIDKLQYTH